MAESHLPSFTSTFLELYCNLREVLSSSLSVKESKELPSFFLSILSSLFFLRIWGASSLFPIRPFLRFEEQVKKCQHKRNTHIRPTKIGGLVARLINLHLKLRDLLGVDVLSDSGVHHLLHLVLRRRRLAVLCTQHIQGGGDSQGSLRIISLECSKK